MLLAISRTLGELAERLGQPALVGELVGGILIGVVVHSFPEYFPLFSGLSGDRMFIAITDLGVFFLMLLAGIEMRPHTLVQGAGRSLLVALGGMVLPLGLGFGLGWLFLPESPYLMIQCLFLGTALAITAVPVAVKILIDMGQLESPVGRMIVAAALFDDILSLVLLAVLTSMMGTGERMDAVGFARLTGQVLLFFAVTTAFGLYLLPKLTSLSKHSLGEELEFSGLVLVALGFAVLAEFLHMHFIIGAFMAGLFFTRRAISRKVFNDVEKKVSALTKGLLAPIFFASIGLHLDLGALTQAPLFVLVLIAVAFGSKMLGAGVAARAGGMDWRLALIVGVGMSARGAVELIIAEIALRAGLFEHPQPAPPVVSYMYSAVVLMAIVTTLLTPIGLRVLIPGKKSGQKSR